MLYLFKYIRKSKNGDEVTVAMDVIERAGTLKKVNLVNVLAKKQTTERSVNTSGSATSAGQTTATCMTAQ